MNCFLLTLGLPHLVGRDSQIPLFSEKAALLALGIYSVLQDSTILLAATVLYREGREIISYLVFLLTHSKS